MAKKLKIGFFTDTYKPQINGVVYSIDSFRLELEKRGHEVIIFCPKVASEKSTRKIVRFRSFKFIFQPEYHISIPFSKKLLKELWAKDLDIVHAHTPFSLGQLGYYFSFIKKVPFVYTFHTHYTEYVKSYLFKGKIITPKMVGKLISIFSNRCNLNIAPSQKMKDFLKSTGVKKPIDILATGLDLKAFKKPKLNNFKANLGIKSDEKVVLFVGRVGKEKNISFLIRSFKLISQKNDKVKFVVIGDGPDKKNLEKLVRSLNIQDKVVFAGYFKKPDVVRAYYASDIFIFASKTDTQGMVILEAAACGLPIVAVKDGAFSSMLINNQNGYATRQNKVEFSQQVIKLLNNQQLYNKMSKRSCEIAKDFTMAKQADRLVKMYSELIK